MRNKHQKEHGIGYGAAPVAYDDPNLLAVPFRWTVALARGTAPSTRSAASRPRPSVRDFGELAFISASLVGLSFAAIWTTTL